MALFMQCILRARVAGRQPVAGHITTAVQLTALLLRGGAIAPCGRAKSLERAIPGSPTKYHLAGSNQRGAIPDGPEAKFASARVVAAPARGAIITRNGHNLAHSGYNILSGGQVQSSYKNECV